jgi:hypothetical protein
MLQAYDEEGAARWKGGVLATPLGINRGSRGKIEGAGRSFESAVNDGVPMPAY